MIERLASVLYILGCIIAIPIFILGGLLSYGEAEPIILGIAAVAATIPFGIGWAIRYILTGKL